MRQRAGFGRGARGGWGCHERGRSQRLLGPRGGQAGHRQRWALQPHAAGATVRLERRWAAHLVHVSKAGEAGERGEGGEGLGRLLALQGGALAILLRLGASCMHGRLGAHCQCLEEAPGGGAAGRCHAGGQQGGGAESAGGGHDGCCWLLGERVAGGGSCDSVKARDPGCFYAAISSGRGSSRLSPCGGFSRLPEPCSACWAAMHPIHFPAGSLQPWQPRWQFEASGKPRSALAGGPGVGGVAAAPPPKGGCMSCFMAFTPLGQHRALS